LTAPSLRPFRAGLAFGAFNGLTWMVGLGTPMVLLAEALGGSALQVGLATSFVFLVLPIQVLATAALPRLGYKRQMTLGWGVRAGFLLVPLLLAVVAPSPPAPWMAGALVASVFGFCVFRAFGAAAHIPWMAAILPPELRGRFFATDSAITAAVGVGTLLLSAQLFARFPGWPAFALVYGIAILGSGLAVTSLSRLPSAPPPPPTPVRTLHREAARLCLAPGAFRTYLLLSLLAGSTTTSIAPFAAYYLKVEAGLSESSILGFTALQFVGQSLGGSSIRAVIDRVPLRRLFRLAALVFVGVQGFWLSHLAQGASLTRWMPLAYLGLGYAAGVSNAAHFTMLPELSEAERRSVSVSVFTATLGVMTGLAPIVWGALLKSGGPHPGLHLDRFAAFFAIGVLSNLLLLALYRFLPDRRR
jgi:MFS family permease